MHGEFQVSDAVASQHDAFAVFQLVSDRISLADALNYLQMTLEQVRPHVAEWNRIHDQLPAKQIILE